SSTPRAARQTHCAAWGADDRADLDRNRKHRALPISFDFPRQNPVDAPSTMRRMVPLPRCAEEEQVYHAHSSTISERGWAPPPLGGGGGARRGGGGRLLLRSAGGAITPDGGWCGPRGAPRS